MPGRSPHEIALSEEERAELKHRAACYTRPHREVLRAKLVLLAAEGATNTEIGEQPGDDAASPWGAGENASANRASRESRI